MAETKTRKPLRELNGMELRQRHRTAPSAEKATVLAELRRRRDNLRGAVIPVWEREARGADPADWKLT